MAWALCRLFWKWRMPHGSAHRHSPEWITVLIIISIILRWTTTLGIDICIRCMVWSCVLVAMYVCVYMSWNNGCIQFALLEETELVIYFASHCLKGNCILGGEDFIFIIALYVPLLIWDGEWIWISLKAGKRIGRNYYTEKNKTEWKSWA